VHIAFQVTNSKLLHSTGIGYSCVASKHEHTIAPDDERMLSTSTSLHGISGTVLLEKLMVAHVFERFLACNQDNSASVVTGLWLDGRSLIPGYSRNVCSSYLVGIWLKQTGPKSH
jgi:hypothetical protein